MQWQPIRDLKRRVPREMPVLAYFPHLGAPVIAWQRSTFDYTWNRYPGPPYAWVVSHSTTYASAVRGHPTHFMEVPPSPTFTDKAKPLVTRYEEVAAAAMAE